MAGRVLGILATYLVILAIFLIPGISLLYAFYYFVKFCRYVMGG